MSTKIYDAYRIKKSTDILSVLVKGKEIAKNIIAADEKYLYMIHALSMVKALDTLKNNADDVHAKNAIKMNEENLIDDWWLFNQLEKANKSMVKDPLDVNISCSVFYDRNFWYLKFYPNTNMHYKILNQIVSDCDLEDYHYQNQCDPPDNIPYKTYENRAKKWDKLLAPDDNFRNGFQFTIFDSHDFRNLISKNYYMGKKTNEELYEHLAYKFDKKLNEENND